MSGKGSAYVVDGKWKEIALELMRGKGWNKAELADDIDCSRTAITKLFSKKGKQSELVPKIEEALGMKAGWERAPSGETFRTAYRTEVELRMAATAALQHDLDTIGHRLEGISEAADISGMQLIELIQGFVFLDPTDRARILERVNMLQAEAVAQRAASRTKK